MTFVFSIPAVFLLQPVLTDPNYIVSAGAERQVLLGAFFDLVTALACIGTAVALYPVLKRQSEAFSIGFVTTRIYEAGVIVVGVVSILALVAIRQAGGAPGTDTPALVAVGQALVSVRDATFLLGPGVVPGLNALLLGYVLYRSRLVPRAIPALGLIGAPLFLVVCRRIDPRRQRAGLCAVRDRASADLLLGAVARPLADLQGLPALSHGRARL